MVADLCYNYFEEFRGSVQKCMMESNDFISILNLNLKNENRILKSINVQSITFPLFIDEV